MQKPQAELIKMEMEQEIRTSELQREDVGVTVCNARGEFVEVNETSAEMYGYTVDELESMSVYDLTTKIKEEGKEFASLFSGGERSHQCEIKTGGGLKATIKSRSWPIKCGGENCLLSIIDEIEYHDESVVEKSEDDASKSVDEDDFDTLSSDRLKEVVKTVRVDAPSGEMPLNAILLDLAESHNELEQYKKGALGLTQALDEALIEAEKLNPDSDEVKVLQAAKDSAFGLYLRLQRGDEELHGHRDGEYSGYFNE